MKILRIVFFFALLSFSISSLYAQEFPAFEDLQIAEWSQIDVPDGICLYGADYSFFVRPPEQASNKLMIYFQGGGACWDGLTCGTIGGFASQYDVTADELDWYQNGYFDFDNPDNPVADYNIVFVPYCTGDVHTGDNVMTFNVPPEADSDLETVTANFKGHANAQLVLEWVYGNFVEPEQILISGCSAGGYGAVAQAPYIMEYYQDSSALMLADSSQGVLPIAWEGFLNWGTLDNLPDFIVDLADVSVEDYDTTYQIEQMALYFPENKFAQYNSFFDAVQIGFYGALLGYDLSFENDIVEVATDWSSNLARNLSSLSRIDNFNYYTAGGSQHCLVIYQEFYDYEIRGLVFSDWLANLLEGDVSNVSCSILTGECLNAPNEEE
jgi:Pectinacetylesterase